MNIEYMVIPMDLTEKQLLIYLQLYKRCNFRDMTVKCTLVQLANGIRIVNISTSSIYRNIKTMINKGYIELVKKASKGNAPVYRLVTINLNR